MKRPLSFSPGVEFTLASAAETPEQWNEMRAAYRHAVFAEHLSVPDAVRFATTITATGTAQTFRPVPEEVELLPEDAYTSPEHTIFAFSELSGLGHEIIPALRAAWLRGVGTDGISPYYRALSLAVDQWDSPDADLLPRIN